MAETTHSQNAVVTLPSDTEIVITRVFDAPKHLVYQAWTTPEHIARWWVGDRGVATVVEVDLRVGGAWRYVMTANGGFEVAFHGEYHEIVPNKRLVTTEVYEAMPDLPALTVCTFSEEAGRTTVTLLVRHTNKEARDTHLSYGMEGGMNEAFDKLDAIAISLA